MKLCLVAIALCHALFATEFVVIIPSYNNSRYVEKNLSSLLSQEGTNWRAIYVDDASTDDTYRKATEIIEHSPKKNQISLIHNSERRGALENLYKAILTCQNEEVIVTLDGDDWFPHTGVIQYLNHVYQDPYIWMTYGSYMNYPSGKRGKASKQVPLSLLFTENLRHYTWMTSHLRTFYAGLFKKIQLESLIYEGKCFPMAWDQAIMFPMIEMARDHASYIDSILYVYNGENPISDGKVSKSLMANCRNTILKRPPYAAIKGSLFSKDNADETLNPDLVAFSYNRPLQLYAFLESVARYASHLGRISVIYRASDERYTTAYNQVKQAFPSVNFIAQGSQPQQDFKPLCLQAVYDKTSPSQYVVFAVDDIILKDHVDFKECAQALETTQAYGFYLRCSQYADYCYALNAPMRIPYLIALPNNIYAWQFDQGQHDWNYPHTVDLTVYNKSVIEPNLRGMDYMHPNSFEGNWAARPPVHPIGLCYQDSKMVNIPLNLVNISNNRHMNAYSAEDLLDKFNQGLKIDISTLYRIQNRSPHIDYDPTFIPR